MSRNWTSMRDMPSNESRLARRQTEASSLNEFNVPHFILLLDSINECSSTCPGVITCSKILLPAADVLNGSALTTLLQWSVDEHRQHLWIRSLVAGYLIKELHEGASTQTKAALVDHIVEFACEFRTADKHGQSPLKTPKSFLTCRLHSRKSAYRCLHRAVSGRDIFLRSSFALFGFKRHTWQRIALCRSYRAKSRALHNRAHPAV